jgi:mono/diheme cytochrome c family protein
MVRSLLLLLLTAFFLRAGAQQITWYEHIAPLVHANCTPCHQQGEAAPFPLVTYDDVAKRAAFVKKVTQNHYMPPWMADPHYVTFANERKLTDQQIADIANWVDHKMPKGKPVKEEVPLPATQYGREPDLVLSMPKAWHVVGDNSDRFIIYKLPFELPDSMNVEGLEFTTSDKKVIHHANYEIDNVPTGDINSTADYIDHTDGDQLDFFQNYVPYKMHMVYFGGWIPGSTYESYPENTGWVMPKRGVVLLTIHYAPIAKDEDVISGVRFYFTKKPIQRTIKAINLGSGGVGEKNIDPYFFIPANVVKTFNLKVKVPEDQSLLYVWPHMHLLGKIFKAYCITPTSDTIRLVSIPSWNFNWQEIYWFPKYLKLPKGSVIHIEGTYDNTTDNPFNPSSPPQMVYQAMRSKDEMMTLIMVSIPYQQGDELKEIKR